MRKHLAKYLTAIALTAQSLAYSAEIACSGLFLSNRDSIQVGAHTFFGGIDYTRANFHWIEEWDLDAVWASANFFTGFQSQFKHITMGASFKGISLGSGKITWTPTEQMGLYTIDAPWESSVLQKNAWIEGEYAGHALRAFIGNARSAPVNQSEEYYIRDSANVWTFGGAYVLAYADAQLQYTYVNADLTLQGIRTQDDTRKRFLYLPFKASAHTVEFDMKAGNIDINAMGIRANLRLENEGKRFYETLSPNRALRGSVLQVLSFSFLQKNIRENAELEASAATLGTTYNKPIKIRKAMLTPAISADLFYATGTIEGTQVEETTKLLAISKTARNFGRKADCFGTFLGLATSLNIGPWALSASARQIVPVVIKFKRTIDATDALGGSSAGNSSASEPSIVSDDSKAISEFGNGMFVSASLSLSL